MEHVRRGMGVIAFCLWTPLPATSQDPPPSPPADSAAVTESSDPAPLRPVLFDSGETLELTLEADFHELKRDRDDESEDRPARLTINAPGTPTTLDIQVRTRGNFRLQRRNCSFPPLRLNFRKQGSEGTPFAGQDKIKLVVHCQDRDQYEQYLLKEYLVYRTYNVLDDQSFRVRLARITYVDTSGDDDPVTRFAFMIEDEDAMAERIGGTMNQTEQIHPGWVDANAATLMSVFQYMMGNTDWSLVHLHNIVGVRTSPATVVLVPYDFDWTGAVNARYARPDPALPIRNVRERVYRGFCWEGVDYQAVYAEFLEKKDEIYGLYQQQVGLDPDERKRSLEYLDDFYEIISDPGKANRWISGACRRWN